LGTLSPNRSGFVSRTIEKSSSQRAITGAIGWPVCKVLRFTDTLPAKSVVPALNPASVVEVRKSLGTGHAARLPAQAAVVEEKRPRGVAGVAADAGVQRCCRDGAS
jgi:hypothetical protein